jgi:hypothetical protein
MATDREILKQQEAGSLCTTAAVDPINEVAKAHSLWLGFAKAADDAMASTATAETYTGVLVPVKSRIKAINYIATTGGVTADATNNAVITVSYRDSTGGNAVVLGTFTSNVAGGNVTQGAPKAFTLTAANVIVAANGSLTYTITKGGSGVVVRAGNFTVECEAV